MRTTILVSIFILINTVLSIAQSPQHFSELPIFQNGKNGYACYRIPAIIKAPNGELLAFAEGRVNGCNDFGNVDILLRKADSNGITWNEISIVADNGKFQAGNAAPVVDMLDPKYPAGRIFLFYNTGNNHEGEIRKGNGLREVWYITSTDNGDTWSTPTNITTSVHRPNAPTINPKYNFKEDWRSYANSPGHAIQLKQDKHKGRIFVPANHSEGPPDNNFNDYKAHAFYSDDHGETWQLSETVDVPSSNESHAVELSDGRVMQNIRHQNGSQRERLVAISSDGGATWDSTYFDAQLPSPVCQASIIEYITPDKDRVLLFSNPNSKERRVNMTVRVSYDDGQTWLLSRIIRSGESAYSDLVIQNNNAIGLLYEHGNDNGIHFANFNYEWLINGKNQPDNQFVKKVINKNDPYAKEFDFALAPPMIESESIFFEEKNNVKLLLGLKGARIHYTLDGTTPTEQSPLFSEKITLTSSVILKAKAFHPQCLPSNTVSSRFIKLGKSLPIKNITINQTPHKNYPGIGAKGLVDRKKGTTNFRTSHWMGFAGGDLEAVIELEKKTNFQKVTASLLSDQGSWIFMPESIEVYCSKDGKDFKLLNSKKINPTKEGEAIGLHFEEVTFPKDKAKFIKVVLKNIPSIPGWHDGKGTPPWLFIDEILIE
ncbi:MAG: exo-alpha-sialidase [Saprospiraceae bacterium]